MKIKYFSIAMSFMIYSHVIFGSTQEETLDGLFAKTPTVLGYIANMEDMALREFSPVFASTNAAYFAYESLNKENPIIISELSKDDRKKLCAYRREIFFKAYKDKRASLE